MAQALTGQRVIITRPRAQAELWSELLMARGVITEIVPLLELRAVSDEEQVQEIKTRVLDFDLYQKAIFVSQNAVEFGLHWLENYWPQLPQGIEYFAVGETTARQLQQQGIRVSALTAIATGAMNSESLLRAPELQNVNGEKIIIFRGCGGRGHMGEILQARGARVDYCELYERLLPEVAQQQLVAAFNDAEKWQYHNVIALHSGESLKNYCQLLEQLKTERATHNVGQKIQALPVLVPGQRVKELAQAAGFVDIILAENATDQSMLMALQNQENP